MPRKKNLKPEVRTGEDIKNADPGDYCYYLNTSNKPVFAEIKKVFTENDILVFQLICQSEFKYMSIPASLCAFNEKDLKGKKRADLWPKKEGENV